MEEKTKKLIITSIFAYTVGTFIFAVGLMTNKIIGIILFYIIAMVLIICGILALYNNYKKNDKYKIYLYLLVTGLFFALVNTVVFVNNIIH